MSKQHSATVAARAGIAQDSAYGAVTPPLYLTSTYELKAFKQPGKYDYSRSNNPTRDLLGDALAELEGGAKGLITGTGMSACLLALQLIGPEDTLVIPHDCYGGSYRLFLNLATRKKAFKLVVVNFQQADWAEQIKAVQPKMIWVETPSNPLLQITDVKATAELAKTLNAILVVDNTFLSPALQNPIALGADIVVHSTTKFINGHSDIVGGALITKDAAVGDELKWWANCLGVTGGAFDAYQTLRGLRTLLPRIKQHQHNAELVVDFLQKQPLVGRIYYPGLKDHPGHAIAKAQQHGFGSMLSFDLAADEAYLAVFFEALQCFTLAQSLGGIESLICHPGSMTHASLDAATQKAAGIGPTLIRLSVGIEDIQDLIADLAQAFAAVDAAIKQNNPIAKVQSEPATAATTEQQQFRLNPALSVLW
ncbi:MAG: cystathionine gamma-synthase [Gammaproteobacteria bacterium]|nr:cystathionine gamma-synthase [Gammaproteobacteria bacterium]MBU2056349.1 cystathionine gamma-synthase [Gammaproteobacteria bacterium]MBU2177242.1 cystathionine gamma-synthase [Gammaproteobacteria bacterium]MBU2246144.1 cystathionine gamma-synthase [Gammaproteobacteria bacterium]MBU2342992.1 cystathionine gamma-synthase [Gammaproteobacteria bacterium]